MKSLVLRFMLFGEICKKKRISSLNYYVCFVLFCSVLYFKAISFFLINFSFAKRLFFLNNASPRLRFEGYLEFSAHIYFLIFHGSFFMSIF